MKTQYALAALVLFVIEVLIALFVHDGFIRPYIGDVLAVMLVYCALRALTPMLMMTALGATLAIALAIEIAQLFHLLDALGLSGNQLARIVLGGLFDVLDLVAYAASACVIAGVEILRRRLKP